MSITHWGQGYNRPTGCSAEKTTHANLTFVLTNMLTWMHERSTKNLLDTIKYSIDNIDIDLILVL